MFLSPFPTGNHVETPELEDFIYALIAGLLAQSSSASGATSIIAIALTDLLSAGAAKNKHHIYCMHTGERQQTVCRQICTAMKEIKD